MKKYIKANSQVTVYRGVPVGMEEKGDCRYYFVKKNGEVEYGDLEDEVKTKIDSYLDNKDIKGGHVTKRSINCSMQEDILSYHEKEELGKEIFAIVKKYFEDWGTGRSFGGVTYSEYDILEYTFRIRNDYLNSRSKYVAGVNTYDAPDLNAFRKEVRQLLKSYGFNRCKFDLKQFKVNEGNRTGYYTPYDRIYTYKELVAIYFAK